MAFDSFIQSSAYYLQQEYPQWRENGTNKSPICIPAASDVAYERCMSLAKADMSSEEQAEKVLDDFERKRKCKMAEQKLHQYLQSSDIGGIVIQDISLEGIRRRLGMRWNGKSKLDM